MRVVLLLSLFAACAPAPSSTPVAEAPPPAITLDASAIAAGNTAIFEVFNAPANATLDIVASRAGTGTFCPPILGGTCLGLAPQVTLLGQAVADGTGHARLLRPIPALPAGTAAFQAVWRGAAPAWVSNVIERDLQPGPAQHINTLYDDQLAGNWQLEVWPCAGSGSPVVNLNSTNRVGAGLKSAAVNMACVGGYSGVGFDRRTADWSRIDWLYPNQHTEARFRFHPGNSLVDDADLDVTLDLDFRLPLSRYLGQPDARGWYDVVVPLADLNPTGDRWHRFMLFQSVPSGAPEFVIDRFQVVWRDDLHPPVVSGFGITDVGPDGATLSFATDEFARVDVTATGGGTTVTVPAGDFAREHEVVLTGLPSATQIDVVLTAADHQEAGPTYLSSAPGRFVTLAADVTAPLISGFRVDRAGATIATVCWTTDEPATHSVAFGTVVQNRTATIPFLTAAPCVNLTGLTPFQTYTWTVTSTDRWGNARSALSTVNVTTGAVPTTAASVQRTVPVSPFDDAIRGVNLGNWSYFWGRPYPGDSPKLRALTDIIRPGVVRFSGGNWSNEVMWDPNDTQCYPQEGGCRRSTFDPKVGGLDRCSGGAPVAVPEAYQHAYQADELANVVDFANDVGADLMVEVNAATCDPVMWADMVRYANVTNHWGVRYWEIGNEFDYNAHVLGLDVPTGADYAARYVQYANALKAVDPTIEVVGPAASQHEDDPVFQAESDLMLPLLDDPTVQNGDLLDVLSWHVYPKWNGEAPVTPTDLFALGLPGAFDSRAHLDVCVPEKRAWLDGRGMVDTTIAITEFQGLVIAEPTLLNVNHAGALYLLDALPRLAASGADLVLNWDLADDADDNGYGLVRHNESQISADPVSHAIDLDDNYTPNPAWYGYAMLSGLFGDGLVASTSNRDTLAVWASTDTARPGDLWLLVVNFSDDATIGTINLGGWIPSNGARAWTLTNPSFVEAVEKDAVPFGTMINNLSIDTRSDATIRSSWAAIEASGLAIFPNANGVTRTFNGYTATAILLDGP